MLWVSHLSPLILPVNRCHFHPSRRNSGSDYFVDLHVAQAVVVILNDLFSLNIFLQCASILPFLDGLELELYCASKFVRYSMEL